MTFKPAHKDTDTPPGQIVNPIERSKTIGGIIDRVMRSEAQPIEPKLSFREWYIRNEHLTYNKTEYECMELAWKAAQENV